VIVNALDLKQRTILGFTDLDPDKTCLGDVRRLGDDEIVLMYDPDSVVLVNGVGSIARQTTRRMIFERFRQKGYHFEPVRHPASIVAPDVKLSEGTQVMAGAILQPGCMLGVNTIINTGAVLDHDCHIGDHVHIAPGAVLSGTVRIGNETHVGTGAVVNQGISIGAGSIIGAGSVVVRDVPDRVTIAGVPGRIIRTHRQD